MKTVFFGSPKTAIPFLEELNAMVEVSLTITQPDKPAGRGLKLTPCPVKVRAAKLGLKTLSPEKPSALAHYFAELQPDLGIAVAYGKIFKKADIAAFKLGIINIHFSLLPKYRGAAPVQRVLFDGENKTGITAFWIDEGLDSGLIAARETLNISPQDDSLTLFEKLSALGVKTLRRVVEDIKRGDIIKTSQRGEPSFARVIKKEETFISFAKCDAVSIHNKTRGLAAGLPAYARALTPSGEIVQLLRTSLPQRLPKDAKNARAGGIVCVERDEGVFVQCCKGVLCAQTVRPAGKKAMAAQAYLNGKNLRAGGVIFIC
jgi:methionyl-tRNA formyltransferase